MNAQEHLARVVDHSIAQISAKLDGYLGDAATMLPLLGYEQTVARMNAFLVAAAREHPDAVASLAAMAIARLARDGEVSR